MDMTGGCLCGAVRYRITKPPIVVTHCHCSTCRRAAGAAFVTWLTVGVDGFAYTEGVPAVHRSSPEVGRGFCNRCGTSLSFSSTAYPDELDITVGSLDDPGAATPQDHIWVDAMVPWLNLDDGLPRLPRSHWEHGYPHKT